MYVCNDCSINITEYSVCGGSRICFDCRDNNYFYCDGCDEYVHENYQSHYDSDYCEYCDCNRDDDEDDSIIKSYSYKPSKPQFMKVKKEKTGLFYGLELEIERVKSTVDVYKLAKEIDSSNWYFKNDGSLSNGFEIVTHPMTYNYIDKNKNLFSNMLKIIKQNNYKSFNTKSCGMHIHLSKNCFGTWQLYRFMNFFMKNQDFILKISQRKPDNLNSWASIENDDTKTLIKKAKRKAGNQRRYVAINLQNSSTVEIRIFRGTLNEKSFFKNIEFCDAMYYFSRDYKKMDKENFIDFVINDNRYKNLKNYIVDKNLIM